MPRFHPRDDWSARHAHPGHEVGCRLDPAQAHSLRILASPDNHVDFEGGFLHPPRCAPKPLRKARVPLSTHISCGTVLPVCPAQVVPVLRDAVHGSPPRLATNSTLPPRKLVGLTGFACVGQGLDLYMQFVSPGAPSPVPALGANVHAYSVGPGLAIH